MDWKELHKRNICQYHQCRNKIREKEEDLIPFLTLYCNMHEELQAKEDQEEEYNRLHAILEAFKTAEGTYAVPTDPVKQEAIEWVICKTAGNCW